MKGPDGGDAGEGPLQDDTQEPGGAGAAPAETPGRGADDRRDQRGHTAIPDGRAVDIWGVSGGEPRGDCCLVQPPHEHDNATEVVLGALTANGSKGAMDRV
jgi:hypothetical protein